VPYCPELWASRFDFLGFIVTLLITRRSFGIRWGVWLHRSFSLAIDGRVGAESVDLALALTGRLCAPPARHHCGSMRDGRSGRLSPPNVVRRRHPIVMKPKYPTI